MSFFNTTEPILRAKQEHLDVQDLKGLWKINWKIGDFTLYSGFYTRIDQAFLLWGWLTLIIFAVGQFLPVSWMTQAHWGSVLTALGILGTIALTYCWSRIEGVTWIVYWWALLLLIGIGLTNFGIFWGWGAILLNLCPLWLGLSTLGYWGTGIGLRSRTFTRAGFVHLGAIFLLPYLASWQFIITGVIMGGTLLLLAEIQWDMRPLTESAWLTAEQLVFNREQQRLRQIK
jgi:hypothetical protein